MRPERSRRSRHVRSSVLRPPRITHGRALQFPRSLRPRRGGAIRPDEALGNRHRLLHGAGTAHRRRRQDRGGRGARAPGPGPRRRDRHIGHAEATEREFDEAFGKVAPDVVDAIRFAIGNIRAFHEEQRPEPMWMKEIRPGAFAGDRWTPIASVALYVPRGKGAFPSVTMMTSVPAVVAGVSADLDLHPADRRRLDRCRDARGGPPGRCLDRLQMRRCPGGRGRRLRHRDRRAEPEDRRPGQPLGRGGEAPPVGCDRHRPAGRAFGSDHLRRRHGRWSARSLGRPDRSRARPRLVRLYRDAQPRRRRRRNGGLAGLSGPR